MTALGPDAPVWKLIPCVDEVIIDRKLYRFRIQVTARGNPRTVVIPLMEYHIKACPRDQAMLIPDPETVDLLSNKGAFAAHMARGPNANLAPATFTTASDTCFPCVVKRLDQNGGHGVSVARDARQLETLLGQPPWRGHGVILQELVRGDTELVTHCVCENGRILWHTTFAFEMNDAEAIRTPDNFVAIRSVPTCATALAGFDAILRPLRYSGPCNIDYKLLSPDHVRVLEINPRLGGSLMRPDKVAYLAEMLTCIIHHAKPGGPPPWRPSTMDWLRAVLNQRSGFTSRMVWRFLRLIGATRAFT